MWNFQNLDEDLQFSGFDSIEALQDANPIDPDYILGLGNKKKKAEKKIKKAEKALSKGNVKKAERKLEKAIKKGTQVADGKRGDLSGKINATRERIDKENESKGAFLESVSPPKKVDEPVRLDPITLQDAPDVSGSGLTTPVSSGGGGEISGGVGGGVMDTIEDEPKEGGTLPGVTITNKKTNWIVVAAILFALVGVFLYLKKRK